MYADMYKMPAQQGWQCPVCRRVYSPQTSMCYSCVKPVKTVTADNTTGYNPRQYETISICETTQSVATDNTESQPKVEPAPSQSQDNGMWKPEHGEKYYYPKLDSSNFFDINTWSENNYHLRLYAAGMVYRTAEKAAEAGKRMYYSEMYRSLSDVTPQMGESSTIVKRYAAWDPGSGKIEILESSYFQSQNVYFTTREKCREAIDKLGENIFLRYVLGVVR